MNGRQSKRIRQLSVKVAGKDAPPSILVPGADRVLQITLPNRKDGKRSDYWKRSRKRTPRKGYVCRFLENSMSYQRGSRAWTLGVLKKMFREDRAAFLELERTAR